MHLLAAIRAFWRVLTSGEEAQPAAAAPAPAAKAAAAPAPAAAAAPANDRFEEGAVYTLALLQREGRLVDFLLEDLSAYNDEQVGAAARRIHQDTAKGLREHFGVAPVLTQAEGEKVTVPAGFDPSAIRLTGTVAAQPPFAGTLQHKGWRAAKVQLPARTGKCDPRIIQPAEVES